MAYGTPPAINGTTLRRPSGISESPEAVDSSVELAGGATRTYDRGVRFVVDLSWSKLTETDVATLRALLRPTYVAYTHTDGVLYQVRSAPLKAEPIPGTDPVRFAASTTLREQGTR